MQIYVGLGLMIKRFPHYKYLWDNVFKQYKLDSLKDIAVAFNLSIYYQIVGDFKNTEKYFIKAINIYKPSSELDKAFMN